MGEVDPPAAYGAAAAGVAVPPAVSPGVIATPRVTPRYSQMAVWGLVCILVSVFPLVVLLPLGLWLAAAATDEEGTRSATVCTAPSRETPDTDSWTQNTQPTTAEVTTRRNDGDQVEISPGGVRIHSGKDSVVVTPGGVRIHSGDDNVRIMPGEFGVSSQPNTSGALVIFKNGRNLALFYLLDGAVGVTGHGSRVGVIRTDTGEQRSTSRKRFSAV